MTIKFSCSCGQHLKAQDELAARRARCPRCGAPVGIPSRRPTHSGTPAAPLTPEERRRLARARTRSEDEATAIDTEALTTEPPRAPEVDSVLLRTEAPLEERKRQAAPGLGACWLSAPRTARICLLLGLGLALASAGFSWLVPRMVVVCLADPAGEMFLGNAFLLLALIPLVVLIGGIPCSFLGNALASANPRSIVLWEGGFVQAALRSAVEWLACFLAGHIVFAAAGCLFWVNCGDPALVDRLILAELSVLCVIWWLYALTAVTDGGRLRDLNPLVVSDVAHRMGPRGFILVFSTATVLLAHGYCLNIGLEQVQAESVLGWLILAVGWVSGLFWGAFFCQGLGLWCKFSRLSVQANPSGASRSV